MKTILINLLFLASVLPFPSSATAETCKRLDNFNLKYMADSIEKNFESFTWSTDLMGYQTDMYFHNDGTLESVQHSGDSEQITFMQWSVKMVDGTSVLTISAADGSSRSLVINPICEGFAASDAFGVQSEIVMHPKENAARRSLTKNQMAGIWNSVAGENTRIRDMRWTLNDDATFRLAVAPDMYHDIRQGIWDISSDGQYLVLYFTEDDNPENVYTIEIVKIRSVDFEDMILDLHDLSLVAGNMRMKNTDKGFTKDFSM